MKKQKGKTKFSPGEITIEDAREHLKFRGTSTMLNNSHNRRMLKTAVGEFLQKLREKRSAS